MKFYNPTPLFNRYPKIKEHFRRGQSYEINGILAHRGGSLKINESLVELRPSFDELINILTNKTSVEHPDQKIFDHLRNIRYNASRKIAPQWGVMDFLGIKSFEELPSCLVVTIDGRDIDLMDRIDVDKSIIMNSIRIFSPLLDKLSEISYKTLY